MTNVVEPSAERNPKEMQQFGFDPDNIDDQAQWDEITAEMQLPSTYDYTEDAWAFGREERSALPQAAKVDKEGLDGSEG